MDMKKVFICVAVGLILFTHLFKLTSVPYGINIDEAGSCYDAWSLARFGVDRYGNSYPVYFQNYGGGGQSPLFVYLLMICFKFVSYSLWVPRLIMLVACLVTAFYGYRFTILVKGAEKEEEKEKYGIAFLLLFSIMPIFIMMFRIGMDSTLMIPTSTAFLYYFTRALRSERKRDYAVAGVSAAIVLYSYVLSYIAIPVMLILSFIYMICIKRKQWKKCIVNGIVMAIPLVILAAPLLMVQLINLLDLPEMYLGCFTFTKMEGYRSSELSRDEFWGQVADAFRYTHFYDELPYNTSSKYGTLYFVSVPFILIGFLKCFKKLIVSFKADVIEPECVPILWCMAEYTVGGLIGGGSEPYSSRMVGIFVVLCYFLTTGLYTVVIFIKNKVSNKVMQKAFPIGMLAIYAICFISFVSYYFGDYTEDEYPLLKLFCHDVSPVVDYFEKEGLQYANMPLYTSMFYMYYALPAKIPPYEMDLTDEDPLWLRNVQFFYPENVGFDGNYAVRSVETESREYLKSKGYKEIPLGDWCVYLTPLTDFQIEQKTTDVIEFCIDKINVEQEQYVIYGWAYRKDRTGHCKEVGLDLNGQFYKAQYLERPDVEEAHGLGEKEAYGFRCAVDMEEAVNATEINVMCDKEILATIDTH